MSEVQEAGPRAAERPSPLGESSWALSVTGVRTVAALELRQRVRSRWWVIMIVIWIAVLAGLTGLIHVTVASGDTNTREAGATMFGGVSILVLSLASLISPALSATSINGDRAQGVLAALQSTLLTPAEIVIGKLVAAWISALALVASAVPFLVWAFLLGGTTGRRLILTIVLIALTLLVVCAIGLGCSALVARTSASGAQTYLLVTLLGLGLPLLFVLSLFLVEEKTSQVQPYLVYSDDLGPDGTPNGSQNASCQFERIEQTQTHTEYTWWLLAASPYVVVADAAPAKAGVGGADFLAGVRDGVRTARLGPEPQPATCAELLAEQNGTGTTTFARRQQADNLPASWPWGLAIDLLIGAAFTVLAIRRLRVPAARLPRGTRVA